MTTTAGGQPPRHLVGGARPDRPAPAAPRRLLLALCLVVALVRVTYALQPLRNDEGGYLLVARGWDPDGEFLYGPYFVDRPPLLLALFRLAALSDWDGTIRLIAVPFAVAFVLAAWRAGAVLGGAVGGRWAAAVGAALMCSPMLAADHAEGELFGPVLVMVSVALALGARHVPSTSRRLALMAAAGVAAGAAPLVRQNLVDGVLFLAVLVLAPVVRRGAARPVLHRCGALDAGAALLGGVVPVAVVAAAALTGGVDPAAAWHDLVTFRGAAVAEIWSGGSRSTLVRAAQLLVLGLVTGVLGVIVGWWRLARPWRPRSPEEAATAVLVLVALAAIVLGGSYWPSYLLGLAPATVLAVAAAAPQAARAARVVRVSARMLVVTAVVGSLAATVVYAAVPRVWFQQRVGEWLADSGRPGDTAFVAYGSPSILEAADMASPYPYLWSVPMRTLDPEQERLRGLLAGPRAPTWIVQVNGWNSWGIDSGGRLRDLVAARYRVVGEVCGIPVWLRADLRRDLAPAPSC